MAELLEVSGCNDHERRCDVIFVHGLDGDGMSTWHVAARPDTSFPVLVGRELPEVGVWSLNYDACSIAWTGHTMPLVDRATNVLALLEVYEIGSRPVIFIAHSLGGLLVKQMLRHASDFGSQHWQHLFNQTVGVIFIATPHTGASLASWMTYLSGVLRTTASVDDLKAQHERLRELSNWYRGASSSSPIATEAYFETRKYRGVLVVDPASADPGILGVVPIPLDSDHVSICKPVGRDSLLLRRTVRFIKQHGKSRSSNDPVMNGNREATKTSLDDLPHIGVTVSVDTELYNVQLRIERPFKSFSPHERKEVIERIRQVLELDTSPPNDISEGSVLINVRKLTPAQAERLKWAVEQGEFDDLGAVSVKVASERSGVERIPELYAISWKEERQWRMHPAVVTSLLREMAPILDFVRWEIRSIDPGWTESVLPLNYESTTEHFTHQAALWLLAAEYTGKIAISSLLPGWPVLGVHPVTSPKSVSIWLLKEEVKHIRPSVGDLTVRTRINEECQDRIRKRFLAGKTVVESLTIEFVNGETVVGEATLTYYARQTDKLRAEGISTDRVNTLYELKLTSSAELIAGVRALENRRGVQDPYAAHMAGQHGMALAKRFCERAPQLGGMVAARTMHLDAALMNFIASGGRDIVIVGVGWDMRPFRLPLPPGTRVFELDFPTTLSARRQRLSDLAIAEPVGVTRVSIPIDVRTMPLAPVLTEHLDTNVPIFIAWEGMNMYFQEDEVRNVLKGMLPLLRHPDSLLWLDLVDRQAVEQPEEFPESVRNFMRGMQILGEPFTFGPDSVAGFMNSVGLRCLEVVPSDVCIRGRKDPVYSVYRFCVASATGLDATLPTTFRKTRIRKKTLALPRPHLEDKTASKRFNQRIQENDDSDRSTEEPKTTQ